MVAEKASYGRVRALQHDHKTPLLADVPAFAAVDAGAWKSIHNVSKHPLHRHCDARHACRAGVSFDESVTTLVLAQRMDAIPLLLPAFADRCAFDRDFPRALLFVFETVL